MCVFFCGEMRKDDFPDVLHLTRIIIEPGIRKQPWVSMFFRCKNTHLLVVMPPIGNTTHGFMLSVSLWVWWEAAVILISYFTLSLSLLSLLYLFVSLISLLSFLFIHLSIHLSIFLSLSPWSLIGSRGSRGVTGLRGPWSSLYLTACYHDGDGYPHTSESHHTWVSLSLSLSSLLPPSVLSPIHLPPYLLLSVLSPPYLPWLPPFSSSSNLSSVYYFITSFSFLLLPLSSPHAVYSLSATQEKLSS